jgi:hypothetical protein
MALVPPQLIRKFIGVQCAGVDQTIISNSLQLFCLQIQSLPIATVMAQQSVRNGDPPCSAVVKIASVVKKIRELDDNESLEAPKALCGRVVNLIIWEDDLWHMAKSNIQIGTFLRLRNVDYQMWRDGNMKGNYHCCCCKAMVLAGLISLFSLFFLMKGFLFTQSRGLLLYPTPHSRFVYY